MGIIELLRKNEKLVYWNRCRIHRDKEKFREMVLQGYQNPDYLKIESKGEEYRGCTIYMADEKGHKMGFFAELGVTLIKLYFADERGLVPYVHWGKNYLYYEPKGVDGVENAFLYYFEPVSRIESIQHAAHIVYSEDCHYEQVKKLFDAVSYDVSEDYVNAMATMLKKYIRYNQKTKQYLEKEYHDLIGSKKTLGIHFRGTDFRKQYNNHPVAVKIEQEIEKTHELLESGKYEQIFLATDEKDAITRFKDEFGDAVKIYEDAYRGNEGSDSIAFSELNRELHHYKLGLEVLRDQYTLVRCSGLVCGYSNVTFLARIMRRGWLEDDYEDYILINNGINHNRNYFSK